MQQTQETYHAYLDESENTDAGQYVVGGFVAPTKVWADLETRWLELLPSGISCFHTTACFGGNEDFKGVDIPERVALLDKLTGFHS